MSFPSPSNAVRPTSWMLHGALFISSLLASAQYSAVKLIIPQYISAMAFLSMRIPVALLFFFALKWSRTTERLHKKDIGIVFVCGLFGVVFNQIGYFKGMALTQPIHGALIMTTCPITIFLLNVWWAKGRLSWLQAIGIAIGFSGALLLLLGKAPIPVASIESTRQGDLWVFFNAIAYSLFLVIQKTIAHKYHPFTIVAYCFLFGGIVVVPWGIPDLLRMEWAQLPMKFWLVAGFIVLCTTVLAYLINSWALSKVEPQVVGVYVYLQPLLATAIAVAIGQDTLTFEKVMYGSMVLLGVYLVGKRKTDPPS